MKLLGNYRFGFDLCGLLLKLLLATAHIFCMSVAKNIESVRV